MGKKYRTEVRTDSDYDEIPEVVEFGIDEATARKIAQLQALVKANDLYKVEQFDYRARYYMHDPLEDPGRRKRRVMRTSLVPKRIA